MLVYRQQFFLMIQQTSNFNQIHVDNNMNIHVDNNINMFCVFYFYFSIVSWL